MGLLIMVDQIQGHLFWRELDLRTVPVPMRRPGGVFAFLTPLGSRPPRTVVDVTRSETCQRGVVMSVVLGLNVTGEPLTLSPFFASVPYCRRRHARSARTLRPETLTRKHHNATMMCLARLRLNLPFAMVKHGDSYEQKTPTAV